MIMNATKYLRYIVTPLIALLLLCGCREEQEETQLTEFTLRVDESVSIKLPQSNAYTLTTDNPIIDYTQSSNRLNVTAIKEGKATLTVMLDSGESRSYTFTVTANASQIGFTIISTPRVESWIGLSLKTEQTAGLQVSCEPGVDIRPAGELRTGPRHHRLGSQRHHLLLRLPLPRDGQTAALLGSGRFYPKGLVEQWSYRNP